MAQWKDGIGKKNEDKIVKNELKAIISIPLRNIVVVLAKVG